MHRCPWWDSVRGRAERALVRAQVAIKFLERGAGVSRGVVREVLNHRLCVAHPNIAQFREVFLTPSHLAIVMEFAAGGDMFEYVIKNKGSGPGEGLAEEVARGFFQQLILALDFCQKLGIANRCAAARASEGRWCNPGACGPGGVHACSMHASGCRHAWVPAWHSLVKAAVRHALGGTPLCEQYPLSGH